LSLWTVWYNGDRPHETLAARTPDEVYFHRPPACRSPRYEPRPRWPRRSPCAGTSCAHPWASRYSCRSRRQVHVRPQAPSGRRAPQGRVTTEASRGDSLMTTGVVCPHSTHSAFFRPQLASQRGWTPVPGRFRPAPPRR
jgi:hypothetical protein